MNWIAWQKGTWQKPEVALIAERLKCSIGDAVLSCIRVWEWADENVRDGHVDGMNAARLSLLVGIPGIGEAMLTCGWLLEDRRGILFVHWDRWNSASAKCRMEATMRKARQRARHNST